MSGHQSNDRYSLLDPNAPPEGSDAGSSEDLTRQFLGAKIKGFSNNAELAYSRARRFLTEGETAKSKQFIEKSLLSAAKAFWWAEDTDYEEKQHQLVHEIGKWRHDNLGCKLQFKEGRYSQDCLVAIIHKKMGMSPGFYGTLMCMLCDQDLSECEHKAGRTYWIRGTLNHDGTCRICSKKRCEHRSDYIYRTQVRTRMKNPILQEVSIVRRPAMPENRIMNIPVDSIELIYKLGGQFKIGMPVNCNGCAEECRGFQEFDMPNP
jgi:hypothetical protein